PPAPEVPPIPAPAAPDFGRLATRGPNRLALLAQSVQNAVVGPHLYGERQAGCLETCWLARMKSPANASVKPRHSPVPSSTNWLSARPYVLRLLASTVAGTLGPLVARS